jgi:hypothetical protein
METRSRGGGRIKPEAEPQRRKEGQPTPNRQSGSKQGNKRKQAKRGRTGSREERGSGSDAAADTDQPLGAKERSRRPIGERVVSFPCFLSLSRSLSRARVQGRGWGAGRRIPGGRPIGAHALRTQRSSPWTRNPSG